MEKINDSLIHFWKSKSKGELLNETKRIISGRRGYSCDHCVRQYDDDMCDACLSKMLVNKFQDSLINADALLKARIAGPKDE